MPQLPESPSPSGLADRLRVAPLYLLPHHALSALMRHATRVRLPAWKNRQIRWFIRRYGVEMNLARISAPEAFVHFNAFFTRELKADARPIAAADVTCPADGVLSQFGSITGDTLVQAKGRAFSLARLLGGDADRAATFAHGHFATVYLSPRDYHRVHMPMTGTLREMVHVPGRLFSVNPSSARAVPDLFARNERVVSIFDTTHGPLAMVLVGAVFVGSVEHVWAGQVTPAASRHGVTAWRYPPSGPDAIVLEKGQEMGRFNMGSTVIMALPPVSLAWREGLAADMPVRMGEGLAEIAA